MRFTRLMLHVMSSGWATSHATGIQPAPNDRALGIFSMDVSPAGSPGMCGAWRPVCVRRGLCVAFSPFVGFGVPVVESRADTPASSRLPALSWMYWKCVFSRPSCSLHKSCRRRLSACSLLSGVCLGGVVVMGFVCGRWSVIVVIVIHKHL